MAQTRRQFLQTTWGAGAVLAGGCAGLPRRALQGKPAGARLNVAMIGVGGRGQANWSAVCESGERLVALCDVDEGALLACREKVAVTNPGVRLYKDFRVMLEAERSLDAVFISTPDHGHAVQAAWALDKGCHVYVEPPVARTLREVRLLGGMAASRGLILRMGDQGCRAAEALRAVALLKSGIIGEVSEIHAWTGRPVWPQGVRRPEGSDVVPGSLDWDLWLAGAPLRPYKHNVYHRFNWRGWHDFGTGALGDAGCHLLNVPFRALGLAAPASVEAVEVTERQSETYPKSSQVRFGFAARGRKAPPVTLDWYDGNRKPKADGMEPVTATFDLLPGSGCLLVGDRGVWLVGDDAGTRHYLALRGEANVVDFEKHEACKGETLPEPTPLQQAFLQAVRDGQSGFAEPEVMRPLMECVLAGCVAQRVDGPLTWNSRKARFDGNAEAERLTASASREGWACPQ